MAILKRFFSGFKWRAMRALGYFPTPVQTAIVWLLAPKFLIGVVVILMGQDEVFLVRHRYRPWFPLGLITGFVEHGESLEEAARREIAQETGWSLPSATRLDLLDVYLSGPGHMEALYLLETPYQFPRRVGQSGDGEIAFGAWYPLDQLPSELAQKQRPLIERAAQWVKSQSVSPK